MKALESPTYLETLSGLTELHSGADDLQLWEYAENESITSADSQK